MGTSPPPPPLSFPALRDTHLHSDAANNGCAKGAKGGTDDTLSPSQLPETVSNVSQPPGRRPHTATAPPLTAAGAAAGAAAAPALSPELSPAAGAGWRLSEARKGSVPPPLPPGDAASPQRWEERRACGCPEGVGVVGGAVWGGGGVSGRRSSGWRRTAAVSTGPWGPAGGNFPTACMAGQPTPREASGQIEHLT